MMNMNTDELSLKDLRTLKRQIDRAIVTFEERKRATALAAVKDFAMENGYDLAELTGQKIRRKRQQKYANPNDPDQTWSGVGRQPRWFREAIEKGVQPCELKIQLA